MTTTNTSRLVKLGDTDLTVHGKTVIGQSGDEIARVDALLIDGQERKVRFLQNASGGILSIEEQRLLDAIDAVLAVNDNQPVIDHTGKHISGSPRL